MSALGRNIYGMLIAYTVSSVLSVFGGAASVAWSPGAAPPFEVHYFCAEAVAK
jgi:hypothetical protein